MKQASWIAVAWMLTVLTVAGQNVSMGGFSGLPTGGLGQAGGFTWGAAMTPAAPSTGRVHLGSFARRHFRGNNQVFLFGYGYPFYGYDDADAGYVAYENTPRVNSLPQPAKPVFEAHVPQAPLIIEKVGDQWVRRRVLESGDARGQQAQLQDEAEPSRRESALPCKSRSKNCRK